MTQRGTTTTTTTAWGMWLSGPAAPAAASACMASPAAAGGLDGLVAPCGPATLSVGALSAGLLVAGSTPTILCSFKVGLSSLAALLTFLGLPLAFADLVPIAFGFNGTNLRFAGFSLFVKANYRCSTIFPGGPSAYIFVASAGLSGFGPHCLRV